MIMINCLRGRLRRVFDCKHLCIAVNVFFFFFAYPLKYSFVQFERIAIVGEEFSFSPYLSPDDEEKKDITDEMYYLM